MANDPAGYKFTLYRILGNDLPPRHRTGQTYDNLKFILDYEPDFSNCTKNWIINRIVDADVERRIIALLEKYKQPYILIPFNIQDYNACKKRGLSNYLSLLKTFLSLAKSRKKICGRLGNLVIMWGKHLRFDFAKYNKILYVMNINGARNAALRDGKRIADWVLPFDGNCCFTEQGWKGVIDKLSAQKSADKCFIVPNVSVAPAR